MSAAPDAVILTRQQAAWGVRAFAFAYFFSALVPGGTAPLAPVFAR